MKTCSHTSSAWEDAEKLVKDLQKYWQPAFQLAQKQPHKKKLNKKDQTLIRERIELINQLSSPLNTFGASAQLTEANTILEELVAVAENFFPDSVLLADAYSNLADNYIWRNHKGEQALEYLVKALRITIACLGEHHLKTARLYHTLGYLSLEEPDIAIVYLETARKIAIQLPPEQEGVSSFIFQAYHILGKVYEVKGAYAQALTNYEDLLALVPQLALSKAYTAMIEYNIQNVQEKIDKQNQEKKKDEPSEN